MNVNLGVCSDNPEDITNAEGPMGDAYLEGGNRTYNCGGDNAWSDLKTGIKVITCLASGAWSSISESCHSVFLFLFSTSTYLCHLDDQVTATSSQ